ncbi:MAG: hypothetical protein GX025_00930 [Clostridiales bacterium]|nr:hypothetical protein [Clostridiales bacterium]
MSGLILAYKYSLRNREINATIVGVVRLSPALGAGRHFIGLAIALNNIKTQGNYV